MAYMLTERQNELLEYIIRQHIKTGEPVGSLAITDSGKFEVSPATVRNEMQELVEIGLLAQPHTSAGRIPTDRAYRYFVDELMDPAECIVDAKSRKRLASIASGVSSDDLHGINRVAAQTLSELSETAVIANIEKSPDFYKTGLSELFAFPEFRAFDRMFGMTSFFDRFDMMFDQLEREFFGTGVRKRNHRFAGGITVSIGRENPFPNIKNDTLICGKYRLPSGYAGSFTMIGPVRMNYGKNIGLAQYMVGQLNEFADAHST